MKDIDYSRPLDVHRFSDYPEVDEWVDAFWDEHLEPYFPDNPDKRGPKSKAKPKRMFKVLFLVSASDCALSTSADQMGHKRTK